MSLLWITTLPALAQQAAKGEAVLPGSAWRLEQILYGDGEEVRPNAGGKYTLQFLKDHRLSGQADANRLPSSPGRAYVKPHDTI